jgi:uracil-DNA glycosylase
MSALAGLVDKGLMAPDWAEALAPVDDTIVGLGRFLRTEPEYRPVSTQIFRAFERPLAEVRVLVVGQDPYPNPDYPIGLSFAVRADVRALPESLKNIYKELHADLPHVDPPAHGDLSPWSDQGVMLLNRVLTVRPWQAGSHSGKGWEAVTDCAIDALVARGGPLVAILWGKPAQTLRPRLGTTSVIESSHPSPYSARISFVGSKPFSGTNALLEQQGAEPIDWSLPATVAE